MQIFIIVTKSAQGLLALDYCGIAWSPRVSPEASSSLASKAGEELGLLPTLVICHPDTSC